MPKTVRVRSNLNKLEGRYKILSSPFFFNFKLFKSPRFLLCLSSKSIIPLKIN